jgi:hypothetical protein
MKTFLELPDWKFEVDEVSSNVYEVIASNMFGQKISQTGTNIEQLIHFLTKKAAELDKNRKEKTRLMILPPNSGPTF